MALDGSPFAETALHPAAALVAALSTPATGELYLTQLVQLPTLEEEMEQGRLGIDVDIRQSMLRHAGEYMEAVREQLHRKIADSHVAITWSVEECKDIAEALINSAEGSEVTQEQYITGGWPGITLFAPERGDKACYRLEGASSLGEAPFFLYRTFYLSSADTIFNREMAVMVSIAPVMLP